MPGTTSRVIHSLWRGGLCAALAFSSLALTPRVASAGVIICVGGKCEWGPGGCGSYTPLPAGYLCADIAKAAMIDPHLMRDGNGASVGFGGKTYPVMSDLLIASFAKWKGQIPPKNDPAFARADANYRREFDAAFNGSDRRVGEARLAGFSKSEGFAVETKLRD